MNNPNDNSLYDQAIEGLLRLKTFDSQTSLNSFSSSGSLSDLRQEYRLPPVSQILMPLDSEDDSLFQSSSSLCSLSTRPSVTRRRGRPKKSEAGDTIKKRHSVHSFISMGHQKPRWNDTERQELLEAIVREKNLDDMSTICWDRISAAVGRATKACKDQWRRELLPNIRSRFQTHNKKLKETMNVEI